MSKTIIKKHHDKASAAISIDEMKLDSLNVDTISEKTTDVGVSIEGVLVKDSNISGVGTFNSVGIDDNAQATIVTLQQDATDSLEKMGINNTAPGDYNAALNDLVVGNHTGNHGITIAAGTGSTSFLGFQDVTGNTAQGTIAYDHSANDFTISTNGNNPALIIDTNQQVASRSSFGGFTSSATAQILTADSPEFVLLASPSGSINQDLPTTNVKRGRKFTIKITGATSTNTVVVRSSGGNTIATYRGEGRCVVVANQDTPTTAAHWELVDDYDTYDWDPVFSTGAGGSGPITMTTIEMVWTRNNKLVTFQGNCVPSTGHGATTYFTIGYTGDWGGGLNPAEYRGKGICNSTVAGTNIIASLYSNVRLRMATNGADTRWTLFGQFHIA